MSTSIDPVRDLREVTDEELAERSARGDTAAFATIYERYFDGLYDFAFRSVRDRDVAADVVQDSFTRAWQSLARVAPVKNVKAWLYAIARNSAIDDLRRQKRLVGTDVENDFELAAFNRPVLNGPHESIAHKEVVDLVWDAATSLGPSDYMLLDLHVRRELTVEEISENLGLQKGAVYTRLSRLRRSVEESVTAHVLARVGRRRCPELDRLLSDVDIGTLTPDVRRVINRHLDECDRCSASKKLFLSPLEILAGLVPIPALEGVKDATWAQVATAIDTSLPAPDPTGSTGGAGKAGRSLSRGHSLRWEVAAVGAIVVTGAVLLLSRGGGGSGLRDPGDVHSPSHSIGVASEDNTIAIEWTPVEGMQGYSVDWQEDPTGLPDADVDLPGSAAGTVSPPLPEGDWYFHLRTQDRHGEWTSTVHLGPFPIEDVENASNEEAGEGSVPDRVLGGNISNLAVPRALPRSGVPPSGIGDPTGGDGSGPSPSPNAPPPPRPTPDPTSTPEPTPTATPEPTPMPTAEPTPTGTPTAAPSATPPAPTTAPPFEPPFVPSDPGPTPTGRPAPDPTRTVPPLVESPDPTPTQTQQPDPEPTFTDPPTTDLVAADEDAAFGYVKRRRALLIDRLPFSA